MAKITEENLSELKSQIKSIEEIVFWLKFNINTITKEEYKVRTDKLAAIIKNIKENINAS